MRCYRKKHKQTLSWTYTTKISTAALTVLISAVGCSDKPTNLVLAEGSKVIALGDSLTYGYGATSDTAYPIILAKLTRWDVINAGVNGDTSSGVLARVDDVIDQEPDLVLLGVGGNDVLRRIKPTTTAANIATTINQLKAADIPVVLIAEPYFSTGALFGSASDNPIYADIATSKKVALFDKSAGGWSKVLSNDALKSDQIHANGAGYQLFAENLHDFLQNEGYAK